MWVFLRLTASYIFGRMLSSSVFKDYCVRLACPRRIDKRIRNQPQQL